MNDRYDGDSEESRDAFRAYDENEPVFRRSAWQIWRDACAWQAARATAEQSRPDARPVAVTVPVPTERGIYAWIAEGSASLVLVHTRPSDHSPGGVMKATNIRSCTFYEGCPVEQWHGGTWYGPLTKDATRGAAPSDTPKEDAKRLTQLEHALVYVAHSMHSEPQYMLAEGITLGDVSFVRVKIADIDVSVDLPESVARAMYDAAMQATATKDEERRIAIAASAPRDK